MTFHKATGAARQRTGVVGFVCLVGLLTGVGGSCTSLSNSGRCRVDHGLYWSWARQGSEFAYQIGVVPNISGERKNQSNIIFILRDWITTMTCCTIIWCMMTSHMNWKPHKRILSCSDANLDLTQFCQLHRAHHRWQWPTSTGTNSVMHTPGEGWGQRYTKPELQAKKNNN